MQIYKTAHFSKWAIRENISDAVLRLAIHELEKGLFAANLGGQLYKKRLALIGRGRRSGARLIIALCFTDKAFFLYGFSKNETENINHEQLQTLKQMAKKLLNGSDASLKAAVGKKLLERVHQNEKETTQ